MNNLKEDLKVQIIKQLNLEDVDPTTIKNDEPLFGQGLGLDSIDALELIVLLDNYYQIKLTDPAEGKTVFHSIDSLAEYITQKRA